METLAHDPNQEAQTALFAEAFRGLNPHDIFAHDLRRLYLAPQLAREEVAGFLVDPLLGGENNKIFAIQPAGEDKEPVDDKIIAKIYTPAVYPENIAGLQRHDSASDFGPQKWLLGYPKDWERNLDPILLRNRKITEDDALRCMEYLGVKNVPRLLATELGWTVSIHSFIEGAPKSAGAFTPQDIRAAVDFITTLQQVSPDELHKGMPNAPAMSFILTGDTPVRNTYKKHFALTRTRLATAAQESAQSQSASCDQLPEDMAQYLRSNEVLERCAAYEAQFRRNPPRGYKDFIKKDLRLCHDDLGAHNMLFTADGGLNVVDFELFGWNDPAYAVSSMLCHNRMLDLPPDVHEEAISYYEATAPVPAYIVERVRPLLKLGHLEWVVRCIDSTRPRVTEKRSDDILGFDAERYTQLQIENIERHLAILDTLMKS